MLTLLHGLNNKPESGAKKSRCCFSWGKNQELRKQFWVLHFANFVAPRLFNTKIGYIWEKMTFVTLRGILLFHNVLLWSNKTLSEWVQWGDCLLIVFHTKKYATSVASFIGLFFSISFTTPYFMGTWPLGAEQLVGPQVGSVLYIHLKGAGKFHSAV